MKRVVIVAVLFGFIGLNAKTTSLYEHARALRIASQKEQLKSKDKEAKKPIVAKRVLKDLDKEYSKK